MLPADTIGNEGFQLVAVLQEIPSVKLQQETHDAERGNNAGQLVELFVELPDIETLPRQHVEHRLLGPVQEVVVG